MSNLARLIAVASNVLRVPEKTMRSRVMLLRKNSLWSSVGKGVSADPAPSDASNLLLSFLGGGLVTETPKTVRLLRKSLYVAPKYATPPPLSLFAEFGRKHTLGDTLDALFAQWSERGPPVSLDSNLQLTTISLTIERYSRGWDVEFFLRRDANAPMGQDETSAMTTHIDTSTILRGEFAVINNRPPDWNRGDEQWMVEYECFPELLAAAGHRRLARAAESIAEKGGDLVTSARVSERTFAALADCLARPTHETKGVVRSGEWLGRRNMQSS
jgi:hypothetical protein